MRLICLALLFAVLRLHALAASFDCNAARTSREKLVCSSPKLSALDTDLAKAYNAARAQLSPASATLLQADQRDWITWLDRTCPPNNKAIQPTECLTNGYRERLDQLTPGKGIQRINGVLLFTRAHFVVVAGQTAKNASDQADNDPGFGYGDFAWPQIDAPDRDHTPFNNAAYQAAIKAETCGSEKKATSFEAGIDVDGSTDSSFFLAAANDHFIDVDFVCSSYGWGAAHPLTGQISFLWSLDQQRALTADDILRKDSHWQTALLAPAIAKLKASGRAGWEGDELKKGVADGLTDPAQWDLSADGLTITFGQYQVAAYALGMPEIRFSWAELAPYRNPGFAPKNLPKALPKPRQ